MGSSDFEDGSQLLATIWWYKIFIDVRRAFPRLFFARPAVGRHARFEARSVGHLLRGSFRRRLWCCRYSFGRWFPPSLLRLLNNRRLALDTVIWDRCGRQGRLAVPSLTSSVELPRTSIPFLIQTERALPAVLGQTSGTYAAPPTPRTGGSGLHRWVENSSVAPRQIEA